MHSNDLSTLEEYAGHLALLAAAASIVFALLGASARGLASRADDEYGAGKAARTTAIVSFLIAGTLLAGSVVWWALANNHWGWVPAIVPAMLVARHGLYLRLVRRRGFIGKGIDSPLPETGPLQKGEQKRMFARARAAHDREFARGVLVLRYGVPAIALLLIGMSLFEILFCVDSPKIWDGLPKIAAIQNLADMKRGARYASAGAYVYVLLYLGQRSIKRDLSSGAAIWATVTAAVGPVVGAVLALIWKPSGDFAQAGWTYAAFYFVAGLAPKSAANIVQEAVRRLWFSQDLASRPPPRTLPLTKVRGIDAEIEERLAEEQISDAFALSMSDPLRLYRNTAFDKRQVLDWIDEALLMKWCPNTYEKLQEAGISGAIDLAACGVADVPGDDVQQPFRDLARAVGGKETDLTTLKRVSTLLQQDAQVQLIWGLYQMDEESVSSEDTSNDEEDGQRGLPTATVTPNCSSEKGRNPVERTSDGPWLTFALLVLLFCTLVVSISMLLNDDEKIFSWLVVCGQFFLLAIAVALAWVTVAVRRFVIAEHTVGRLVVAAAMTFGSWRLSILGHPGGRVLIPTLTVAAIAFGVAIAVVWLRDTRLLPATIFPGPLNEFDHVCINGVRATFDGQNFRCRAPLGIFRVSYRLKQSAGVDAVESAPIQMDPTVCRRLPFGDGLIVVGSTEGTKPIGLYWDELLTKLDALAKETVAGSTKAETTPAPASKRQSTTEEDAAKSSSVDVQPEHAATPIIEPVPNIAAPVAPTPLSGPVAFKAELKKADE